MWVIDRKSEKFHSFYLILNVFVRISLSFVLYIPHIFVHHLCVYIFVPTKPFFFNLDCPLATSSPITSEPIINFKRYIDVYCLNGEILSQSFSPIPCLYPSACPYPFLHSSPRMFFSLIFLVPLASPSSMPGYQIEVNINKSR